MPELDEIISSDRGEDVFRLIVGYIPDRFSMVGLVPGGDAITGILIRPE